MSAEAIATRLKRVSQLRQLCLSLGSARINAQASIGLVPTSSTVKEGEPETPDVTKSPTDSNSNST